MQNEYEKNWYVYPISVAITFQLGSFVRRDDYDPICTTNLTKQDDRYLATQECFMDYQIAGPIRLVTVKMIMSLFLLRMNFMLKKERRGLPLHLATSERQVYNTLGVVQEISL